MAFTRTDTRGEAGAIAARTQTETIRANVTFGDFTDCLLAAYDGVARRAFQKFVARGSRKGHENDDWLAAERELGASLQVDVDECENFVHAMVTVSGERSAEVNVAVEGRWMMVLDAQEFVSQGESTLALSTMEWDSVKGCAEVPAESSGRAVVPSWRSGCRMKTDEIENDETEELEEMRLRWGSQPFCLVELPTEVDRARSVCVLGNGILAMKMEKVTA
jgi:hypothetical protein